MRTTQQPESVRHLHPNPPLSEPKAFVVRKAEVYYSTVGG